MTTQARTQFLEAGMRLYPQHGYRVSVRLLAAEAGLSPGMFHHLFDSKDAFVGELLRQKYGEGFERLVLHIPAGAPVCEKLRAALAFVAFFTRDNLPWVHRIFADSSSGAECVSAFIKNHGSRHVPVLTGLLAEGIENGELPPAALSQYFGFIMGGVIEPMIVASHLQSAGLAPPLIAAEFPYLISNEAVTQRIDWALCALFGNQHPQEKP